MLSHIENTPIYSYTQINIAYDRRKNTNTRTHNLHPKSAEHETSNSNEMLNDVDDRDNVVDKKTFTRCQDDDGKPKSQNKTNIYVYACERKEKQYYAKYKRE